APFCKDLYVTKFCSADVEISSVLAVTSSVVLANLDAFSDTSSITDLRLLAILFKFLDKAQISSLCLISKWSTVRSPSATLLAKVLTPFNGAIVRFIKTMVMMPTSNKGITENKNPSLIISHVRECNMLASKSIADIAIISLSG